MIQNIQGYDDGVFTLDLKYYDAMFDMHEHLKEDACKITALLPPGEQNTK